METKRSGIVLGPIRTLFNEGRIGTMTDEQLLERFAARGAEAAEAAEAANIAIEVLVLRHGLKTTVEAAAGRTAGASVISSADGMLRALLMSKLKLAGSAGAVSPTGSTSRRTARSGSMRSSPVSMSCTFVSKVLPS